MIYLVFYDVQSAKAHYHIPRILQNYGYRIQKSVFRCEWTELEEVDIRKQLKPWIKADGDSILWYPTTAFRESAHGGLGMDAPLPTPICYFFG